MRHHTPHEQRFSSNGFEEKRASFGVNNAVSAISAGPPVRNGRFSSNRFEEKRAAFAATYVFSRFCKETAAKRKFFASCRRGREREYSADALVERFSSNGFEEKRAFGIDPGWRV